MSKKKYFNILFIFFVVIGLTGHVFGTGTSSTILPDNMSPEQKNLFNYVMSKSGCDVGEATLVIQMLCDQLTETQSGAFLLYMMNSSAPANFPGMDPQYTLNDYFTNDRQCISMKERFDEDLESFGEMTHEQRLDYCRHCDNDMLVLMTQLSECGDINKINYVIQHSIAEDKFMSELSNIADKMSEDRHLGDLGGIIDKGKDLQKKYKNQSESVGKAISDYDYLKIMGDAPTINDYDGNFNNIDKCINNLNTSYSRVNAVAIVLGLLLFVLGCWGTPIAIAQAIATFGVLTPVAIFVIVLTATTLSINIGLWVTLDILESSINKLEEIKNNIP